MDEPIYQAGVLIGRIAISGDYEEYEGEYIVTPTFFQQTLPTEDKHLSQNITINPIPYKETLNASGGITLSIG